MSSSGQSLAGSKASLLNQELEVEIESLAVTGEGVARYNSAVLFISYAAPGDRLLVKVDFEKKNFYRAKIVKVLSPGPDRQEAPCEYFGSCGGCSWQHIKPETQIQIKNQFFLQGLKKALPDLSFPIDPIQKSPRSFFYRNRIQPRFDNDSLGFFSSRSHSFVHVKKCLLVEEPLQEFFLNPKKLAPYFKKGIPEKLELFLDSAHKASARVCSETESDAQFSQVNRFQNEDLVQKVLELSQSVDFNLCLDLYCGSGNFTFPLQAIHKSKSFFGVELSSALVRAAQKKCSEQNLGPKRIEFISASVDEFLARSLPKKGSLILLDPPRVGSTPFALKSIVKARPRSVIYISCNAVTLSRDLALLKKFSEAESVDFRVSWAGSYEMFPQTAHFESIVHIQMDPH